MTTRPSPSSRGTRGRTVLFVSRVFCCCLLLAIRDAHGNPHTKAYIPYRTDPYDQPKAGGNTADYKSGSSDDHNNENNRKSRPSLYEPETAPEREECPLRFSLGVSRRSNDAAPGLGSLHALSSPLGIQQPPVVYPVLPWQGPGRQILYTTQYEHLGMLTPSKGDVRASASASGESGDGFDTSSFIKEGLTEHLEFPLLFESSAFQTSPLVADVNGDGVLDAILTDYHGGVYAIGLQVGDGNENHGTNHRYFLKAQVPRMYVRRQWVEAMVNETMGIDPYEAEQKAEEEEKKAEEERKAAAAASGEPQDETDAEHAHWGAHHERPHDPYHSYFEYSYGSGNDGHETILRGVTASVLSQDQEHVEGLEKRRGRNHFGAKNDEQHEEELVSHDEKNHGVMNPEEHDGDGLEANHRRLQQVDGGEDNNNNSGGDDPGYADDLGQWGGYADDLQRQDDDIYGNKNHQDEYNEEDPEIHEPDESNPDGQQGDEEEPFEAEGVRVEQEPAYPIDDDVFPDHDDHPDYDDYRNRNYDDFYSGRYSALHEDYFDEKHYIRLPPHILCTPVLVEMPKLYSNNEKETENLLFLPVSYYFDEDEYEGFFSYKRFDHRDSGDETETQRGMYVANAIMIFHFGDNPRWGE